MDDPLALAMLRARLRGGRGRAAGARAASRACSPACCACWRACRHGPAAARRPGALGGGAAGRSRLRARPVRLRGDGRHGGLAFVSPRTGRAVSDSGGRATGGRGCCALPPLLLDEAAGATRGGLARRPAADRPFPRPRRLRPAAPPVAAPRVGAVRPGRAILAESACTDVRRPPATSRTPARRRAVASGTWPTRCPRSCRARCRTCATG